MPRSSYVDFGRFQNEYGSYEKQSFSITIDRVIDIVSGNFFYFSSATPVGLNDEQFYQASHLLNSTNIGADGFSGTLRNYDITILYGSDSVSYVGKEALAKCSQTTYRCCLLTEVSYSINVQGVITESPTFITGIVTHNDTVLDPNSTLLSAYSLSYPYTDEPDFLKRLHIDTTLSVFPTEVERAFDLDISLNSIPVLGLQNIEIGMSIDYADLFDSGEFGETRGDPLLPNYEDGKRARQNFMKQVTLPVEVTTSFTGVVRDQYYGNTAWQWELTDQNFAKEDGSEGGGISKYEVDKEINIMAKYISTQYAPAEIGPPPVPVVPVVVRYFQWVLGKKNYLTDLSYSGGDTGGGNVEATLSYQNEHSDFVTYQHAGIENGSDEIENPPYSTPTPSDIY